MTTATTTLSTGKKVTIKLVPAITVGIPLARRLASVLAPAVGGTLDGMHHDDFIHGVPRTFTEMAITVCNQLEKAEVHNIIYTLIDGLVIDDQPVVDIDTYFMRSYHELFEIIEFALKENFSSFFTGDGMKQRFQKVIGMIAESQINGKSNEE